MSSSTMLEAVGGVSSVTKAAAHEPRRGGLFASLERQLPLSILLLIAPIVASFATWAYHEVRGDLLTAAGERMKMCASQIEELFAYAAGARNRPMELEAANPDVIAYLRA